LFVADDQRAVAAINGATPARRAGTGRAWRSFEDAHSLLHFDDTKRVLMDAHALNP
jgi:hypothetical protein